MNPHNDGYFGLINLYMEQFVTNKYGNTLLSAEEDGSFCDAGIFDPTAHLRATRLILRLSCMMKFKFCPMHVKITFLNRYLKVDASQFVSKHVTNKEGVIKNDDFVEVGINVATDINNMENVKLEDNENMMIIHIYVEGNVLCRMTIKMLEHFV